MSQWIQINNSNCLSTKSLKTFPFTVASYQVNCSTVAYVTKTVKIGYTFT